VAVLTTSIWLYSGLRLRTARFSRVRLLNEPTHMRRQRRPSAAQDTIRGPLLLLAPGSSYSPQQQLPLPVRRNVLAIVSKRRSIFTESKTVMVPTE